MKGFQAAVSDRRRNRLRRYREAHKEIALALDRIDIDALNPGIYDPLPRAQVPDGIAIDDDDGWWTLIVRSDMAGAGLLPDSFRALDPERFIRKHNGGANDDRER